MAVSDGQRDAHFSDPVARASWTFWVAVLAGILELATVVSTFVPGAPFVPFGVVLTIVGVTALAFAVMLSTFKWQDITGVWLPGLAFFFIVGAPLSALFARDRVCRAAG
jgi:hypothetical protein